MYMEGFSAYQEEKTPIRFAAESAEPWNRVMKECERDLSQKIAAKAAFKVPEGDVDEVKMEEIRRATSETVAELLSDHSKEIDAETVNWAKDLAGAEDIDSAETMKGKHLGSILEKYVGEDLVSLIMKKMEGKK